LTFLHNLKNARIYDVGKKKEHTNCRAINMKWL
jgi:hypothetical protein